MAESVDALVSNTSGATRAGSTPALGTRKRVKIIQIRFPFCKELGKHFKLFAGPTLNIGLQEAEIAESARLSQWAMWSSKWNSLDISGWIGLSGLTR